MSAPNNEVRDQELAAVLAKLEEQAKPEHTGPEAGKVVTLDTALVFVRQAAQRFYGCGVVDAAEDLRAAFGQGVAEYLRSRGR